MEEKNQATAAPEQAPTGQVAIQNLYVKDVSFETPNSPQIFMEMGQARPETEHHFSSDIKKLAEGVFDVTLGITVTVKVAGKTAFLVEVKQAGIFGITGFNDEQINLIANTFCLNTLYPYVRELVSSLVARGGFPPLMLPPINFEARYTQPGAQQAAKPAGE